MTRLPLCLPPTRAGYVLAYLTIDRMGRFLMQLMGFVLCAGLFAALASSYHALVRAGGGAA